MFDVDVHPEVFEELEHSRQWYEERAEKLGTEFLDEVNRAAETVRQAPAIWPLYDEQRSIRRYLVHRFLYGLVYRIRHTAVEIIAVMHLRRRPDYWRERLRYWKGNQEGSQQ